MKTCAIAIILALLIPVAGFAQVPYSQDFEGLAMVDGSLSGDGWLVFGNIFDPGMNPMWSHGPWPAPNNQTPGNWEDIVTGQGGVNQGVQQLVVYSDYGNVEHANGNWVESNLFQEQTLPVAVSGVWDFTFDAKMGDLAGSSTALAFIKTLDPNNGWAMTNFITADMTSISANWTGYTLSLDLAGLDGQILQIGFSSTATNYEPCGIFYDNVNLEAQGSTATEETSWGSVKSLFQ